MNRIEQTIFSRRCVLYPQEGAQALVLQCVDEHDLSLLDRETALIQEKASCPFALAGVSIEDWNGELSPWQAPAVFGKADFGGKASQTLSLLENNLLPQLLSACALADDAPVILGGYSLAALFALWSVTKSSRFAAAAAASPSVWFPDWLEYARAHAPRCRGVYLSLGDREERTRNRAMAAVGACIRQQYTLLKEQGIPCTLEWNPGNHFTDSEERTAKAFAWCLERMEGEK